jgi:hypothetical protein
MKENMKRLDPDSVHFRSLYLGIIMNVFVPAILVILGIFLRSKGIGTSPIKSLNLMLIILLAVSASEVFFVIFFRKKFFLSGNDQKEKTSIKTGTEDEFIRYTLIIFSLCLSPTIYGLVYYLLGGTLQWFVIFACITLICFRFFKPGLEQVRKFIRLEEIGGG